MDDEEIRLECLRLAMKFETADDVVAAAQKYYNFVCPNMVEEEEIKF